jgi:hypothetical protein
MSESGGEGDSRLLSGFVSNCVCLTLVDVVSSSRGRDGEVSAGDASRWAEVGLARLGCGAMISLSDVKDPSPTSCIPASVPPRTSLRSADEAGCCLCCRTLSCSPCAGSETTSASITKREQQGWWGLILSEEDDFDHTKPVVWRWDDRLRK